MFFRWHGYGTKTCPCFHQTQSEGEARAKKNPLNFGLNPTQYNSINLRRARSCSLFEHFVFSDGRLTLLFSLMPLWWQFSLYWSGRKWKWIKFEWQGRTQNLWNFELEQAEKCLILRASDNILMSQFEFILSDSFRVTKSRYYTQLFCSAMLKLRLVRDFAPVFSSLSSMSCC